MSYVVVGGGIAGVCCAQTLLSQRTDKSVNVVLITPSSVVKSAGSLKQVSQVLADFDVEEKSVDDFATDFPGLEIVQEEVVSIQDKQNCVVLKSGRKISYVKLAVCTGARPEVIHKNSEYIVGIRDTESADEFAKKLKYAERIVIVGNGGIAMELIFKIRNCPVIWAIRDDSIGTTFLDPGAAEFLISDYLSEKPSQDDCSQETDFRRFKYTVHDLGTNTKNNQHSTAAGSALGPDWHENLLLKGQNKSEKSINIEYKCEINSILISNNNDFKATHIKDKSLRSDHSRWPVYVKLSNGKEFGCDLIVSATGVLPNIEVFTSVEGCELDTERGVSVDSNFQVIGCESGIYAAGDICNCKWNKSEQWLQIKLWTQARQMGIFSALCMISHFEKSEYLLPDICFDLFSHITKFFGYKVVLLGKYNGQGLDKSKCEIVVRVTPKIEYIKLILFEGKLYGAVLIGETDLEETFENLILNGMDLSVFGENLLHASLDLADYFD